MMVLDVLFALCFAVIGAAMCVLAIRSSRLVRRVLKEHTFKVADLKAGPAEIEGRFRASDPIRTLGGEPAVAVRWHIRASYAENEDSSRGIDEIRSASTPFELMDPTGTCVIHLDVGVLLGATVRYKLHDTELEADWPHIWALFPPRKEGESVANIEIEETYVPNDVFGFVSGQATLDDRPAPHEGYRDAKPRFKLHGTDTRPLILAGRDQSTVIRTLLAPSARMTVIGLIALLASVAVVVGRSFAVSIAGF